MPAEGMNRLPRSELLSFEELTRVARVCVERFGIDSLRLTGGEPTVRARLPLLVGALADLGADLSLTTNGTTMRILAHDLVSAGLKRVNVSLDSLQPERFHALTRRTALDQVLDGIDAAVEAGLHPVKINVVLVRGVNDDEILAMARFGRERGVTVRFIEFMPLDADGKWNRSGVVPAEEIMDTIGGMYPIEPMARGHQPAERWRYLDGQGEVGVIPSVTRAFCGSCDRIRLTADGKLRSCLFAADETDLRTLLRAGASDDDLVAAIGATVKAKGPGHEIGQVTFVRPPRSMSQIGG
jgi:cyclic pyranopterin phosphate synthase